MFAVPSFFGYNTTFVSTPVATAATGVGQTSFTANWNAFAGAQYYLLDVSISSSFSSFILQDKVVYTNSYAVTGLTASTTYYYRLRASTTYETDAAAFFTRVTSAGGSLTTTEQQAVNSLVIQMKADGTWTPMKAIYPMVGASAAACAQNLKSSSFTGTFSSGWTFASTGVTPNGTSAYFDTALAPSGNLTNNSTHISYYSRTNSNIATGTREMGVNNIAGAAYNPEYSLFLKDAGSGGGYLGDYGIGVSSSTANSDYFNITSRTTSTSLKFYKNGTLLSTNTNTNTLTSCANSFYLGCRNLDGVGNFFSSRQCAFSSIGDGLTDTQASNFYTAVQAFQVSLSRSV